MCGGGGALPQVPLVSVRDPYAAVATVVVIADGCFGAVAGFGAVKVGLTAAATAAAVALGVIGTPRRRHRKSDDNGQDQQPVLEDERDVGLHSLPEAGRPETWEPDEHGIPSRTDQSTPTLTNSR